jgi:carbonic anhydrase
MYRFTYLIIIACTYFSTIMASEPVRESQATAPDAQGVQAAVSPGPAVPSHEAGTALLPDEALLMLTDGNGRFVKNSLTRPHQTLERRAETARNGQHPFAAILSCSDSRVPLEHLFDAGIGDLFVVRIAGNIADAAEIGTLEYGVEHLGTPLIVVLGHSKCGAVTAVVNNAHVEGSVLAVVDNIVPAVEKARVENPQLQGDELINSAIKANVWQTVADILSKSEEIRSLILAGKLKVVGAIYDIESGVVTNLGEHSQQDQLLKQ